MSSEGAKRGFEHSMRCLGLDYLALYLLHQPFGDGCGAFHALEEYLKEGCSRHSFFSSLKASFFASSQKKQLFSHLYCQRFLQSAAHPDSAARTGALRKSCPPRQLVPFGKQILSQQGCLLIFFKRFSKKLFSCL